MTPCVCHHHRLECDCELGVCENDQTRRFPRVLITILMLTAVVALIAARGCTRAHARWSPEYAQSLPETRAWFKTQHNGRGEWCCDETDGHPYLGDYVVNADGSVTLDLTEGPHDIASDLVLKGANPTGHAVWWYRDISGTHRDYCFAPGALT